MTSLRVVHVNGDQFSVDIRGHTVVVDQPILDGGGDTGPTPTELFVAGLATCVAHYARGHLARHNLDPTGLAVTVDWEFAADRPARVGRIDVRIDPPPSLPEERRAGLLAVASHCTVHNSLSQPPAITIDIAAQRAGATA
jgi:putative redox protein